MAIYSQEEQIALGQVPVWDNPDMLTNNDKPWTLPAPYAAFHYPSIVSRTGQIAYSTASANGPVMLQLGAAGNTLATAAGCHDDVPFSSLQFTPNGRALVYQSGCILPSADLYAMAGDGESAAAFGRNSPRPGSVATPSTMRRTPSATAAWARPYGTPAVCQEPPSA